jgi:anaerobic selenocysteine-containing dehydrogenase
MISDTPAGSSRREFLKRTAKTVVAGVLAAGVVRGAAATQDNKAGGTQSAHDLQRVPDRVFIEYDGKTRAPASRVGDEFSEGGTTVRFREAADRGLAVEVHCPKGPLSRVILRWEHRFAPETVFLGEGALAAARCRSDPN